MPLPEHEPNWPARIILLLALIVWIALALPLLKLLLFIGAPKFMGGPAFVVWLIVAVLLALGAIRVWAPVRGKAFADWVLENWRF